jgi:dTDP-4-dehydrorhamnose reductase
MKILILGNGYVGSNLSKYLQSQNKEFFCFSRESFDYSDLSLLNKFLNNNGITHVINCFGFTGRPNVDECESRKEECWYLNVQLPLLISNLCKTLNVEYIHISSGCIYTGYDTEYTEDDKPNFGLFNESSFYSKSKHAFEMFNDYGCIIRVRMPFCNELNDRSYLTKILKYDNLIDYTNSKTYIPELCEFILEITNSHYKCNDIGTINFVNPQAGNVNDVTLALKSYNLINTNWKIVDVETLNLAAPRSNCVLSINKLKKMFPNFKISTELQAINKALSNINKL